MRSIKELSGRVLLEELLSLNLKEVGAADLFVTAPIILLHRPCLMSLQNISLASLNGLLKELFSLSSLPLLLIVLGPCPKVLIPQVLEVLLHPLYLVYIVHQVVLLRLWELRELNGIEERYFFIKTVLLMRSTSATHTHVGEIPLLNTRIQT